LAKSKANKASKQHHGRPSQAGNALATAHLLGQAQAALDGGAIDTACQVLSQARDASATPQGRQLLVAAYAAQAFARWDKPARALASLERALEVAPDDAELRWLHGSLLRRGGRLRAALPELDQAHRLAPGEARIAFEALLAHLAAGERGQHLAALASGGAPTADLSRAFYAATAGDLSAAEQALARTQHPLAKLARAILLLAKGESHAALATLRQSTADASLPGPVRAYAGLYLGIAYLRRRELQPAVQALTEALGLGLPRDLAREHLTWAYNQLVIDAVLAQDLAGAADWLIKLSELGGPTAEAARNNVAYALRLRGQEMAQAGDYDEAASLWARALEITPRDFVLRQNLAIALERADRADEAIPHWHELAQQAARVGKGKREGASRAEDEALGVHVQAVAHRHLADLYLEEEDIERATVQMERALALVPEDPEARSTLAMLYVEAGAPRKAIPQLERVIAERPEAIDAYINLATAQRLLPDVGAAAKTLERAYALAPDNPLVSIGLGTNLALRALQAPAAPAAETDARRALELLPRGRILGLVALGAVQLAQGKRREAIQTLKRCVRQARDKANAALEVGRAYWQAGEGELAVEAWAEAMKRAKHSPDRFVDLAVEWAKADDIGRCQECLKELLARGAEEEAIDAAEDIIALPQGRPFLRRVLNGMIAWAHDGGVVDRMFLAEGLLRAGDQAAARPLINDLAREAVASDDLEVILFVTDLDYKHKYKLLERGTARIVADWLDAYPRSTWPDFIA